MLMIYPAVFHVEDGTFWAEFPDIEGCQTYGENLQETMENAIDALGGYLAVKLDSNQDIPAPSDISKISADKDCFVSYVSCDISKYRQKTKSIKKTLSIPEWLNDECEKRCLNFSRILQDALIEKLKLG